MAKIEVLTVSCFFMINGQNILNSYIWAPYLLFLEKDLNTESIHLYPKLPLTLISNYRERQLDLQGAVLIYFTVRGRLFFHRVEMSSDASI